MGDVLRRVEIYFLYARYLAVRHKGDGVARGSIGLIGDIARDLPSMGSWDRDYFVEREKYYRERLASLVKRDRLPRSVAQLGL